MLEKDGYTVIVAPNPAEALRTALSHPGTIHLLVTDLILPRMNGRVLAERMILTRPGLKVLFISGYTENVIVQTGEIKWARFLEKPFSREALSSTVREILDEKPDTQG